MRGLHKSKRISWASDDNLRQVRLFLSEEAPILVGLDAQDHLQAKRSRSSSSSGHGSEDILPPGFDAPQNSHQLQINLSEIPLIQWKPPTTFLLNSTWQIVAGEESAEAKDQLQREMRVLEAVYPRPSAIPPDPASSADTEDLPLGDHQIPLIPITAIEDEDAETSYVNSATSAAASMTPQPPQVPVSGSFPPTTGLEPDVIAAASAAFTAIMKSNESGSAIDQDLLIQILSNPKMIEKLVTDYGTSSNPTPPEAVAAPPATFYPHQNGASLPNPHSFGPPSSSQPPPPPPPRDMFYYKHLIHQHGGERETQFRHGPQVGPSNPELANQRARGETKARIMKPCIYFNTSKGCRNGANCSYQHDTTSLPQRSGSSVGPDMQSSKRMKFDREITGT